MARAVVLALAFSPTIGAAVFAIDGASAADGDAGGSPYAPIMIALDTSGSMADSAGRPHLSKMQAARGAVVRLVGVLEAGQGATIGLLAYPGSGSASDSQGCEEGRVQIPLGPPNAQQATGVVYGLQPDGDTPTSAALLKAASELKRTGADHGVIVLVSDGEANCGPPVCKTAQKLNAEGIGLTVNTVGFDLDHDPGAKKDLECAAAATGGVYTDASDTAALQAALEKAASAYLALSATVPATLRTATGSGVDLGTQIPVTVTNNGQQTAVDVRVSIDFGDSAGHGGALLVPRPIRFLGNLASGESRTVSMEVRPANEQGGRTYTWVAAATTASGDGNTVTGTTKVVSSLSEPLGPVLADVQGDVAVLGDSYSSGEGAGQGNYEPNTFTPTEWPAQCRTAQGQPLTFDFPEACRVPPPQAKNSMCHRSMKSYAGDLFGDRARIIACSGAIVGNVDQTMQQSGRQTVPLQASELRNLIRDDEKAGRPPPGAVMMTLGGNDIRFGELAKKCSYGVGCDPALIDLAIGLANPALGTILRLLPGPLSPPPIGEAAIDNVQEMGQSLWRVYTLLDQIINAPDVVRARGGRIAPIVVLPYVRIIPPTQTSGCLALVSNMETGVLNSIYGLLNGTIADVVLAKQQAGRPFYFASDVEDALLPEHTTCASNGQAWANTIQAPSGLFQGPELLLNPDLANGLAHPNVAGYRAEAEALAGWSSTVTPLPSKPIDPGPQPMPAWLSGVLGTSVPVPYAPAGGSFEVAGGGFAPNTTVSGYIASTPRLQTVGWADAGGHAALRVSVPPGLPPGRHHVYLVGLGADGKVLTVSRTVWVGGRLAWLALLGLLVALLTLAWAARERRRWRRADT